MAVGTSAITHVYSRIATTGALTEIGTGSALAGTGVIEIIEVANEEVRIKGSKWLRLTGPSLLCGSE